MPVHDPAGPSYPSTSGNPWGPAPHEPDPWTSSLWARPDTVGGYAQPVDPLPASPPPPPPGPPPKAPGRVLAAVSAVVAILLLIGGAALYGTLHTRGNATAAPPRPSTTTLPSTPTVPRPTPSAPPSTAPSSPPSQQPGTQQPGTQSGSLTPPQAAAAAAVSKGLVDINTTVGYDGSQGAGTGIVLSADGLVLTNHHVVAGATSIRVTDVGNARTYGATVIGYDSTHDVAVLRLQGASGLTVAPLGTSSTVKVGDAVIAVGNAGGVGGTPNAVAGTVRGIDQPITVQDESDGSSKRLTGLIEFDAPIQPGDSGGALVNAAGKVVGVVTAGSVGPASSDTATMTDGFAVPIDRAHAIAEQIIAGHSSSTVHIGATGFLGIQVVPGSQANGSLAGVEVASVVSGSPAEGAGIQPGDVVTAVGGKTVDSTGALHDAIAQHRPGDTLRVDWTDPAGQTHTASVRLATGPVG